jgi:uncharacterized membrane protein YdfJ with MMPL/SSD domain
MSAFPRIIVITVLLVLSLLGIAFGSLLVPLRSVATTSLTLALVYAVLQIAQGGVAYEFFYISAHIDSGSPGVSWIVPVMTFPVLVGLNTDYDIFLISGIRKQRSEGYSNDEAIVLGMRSNGGVITTAGLIMAFAFSGLLYSSTLAVRQVAFVIILAVLTDTFIVRALLVPAIMTLFGDLNWLPTAMPAVCKEPHVFFGARAPSGARRKLGINSRDVETL